MRITALILASVTFCSTGWADNDAGARYDFKTWNATIQGNKFRLKTHHRLTILNARGESYRRITIPQTRNSKLKDVRITVYSSDGAELYTRKQKEMTKYCGYGKYELYNDLCQYTVTLDAPDFPYVIDYEYVMEFPSLFFWRRAILQSKIPVDRALYYLDVPGDFRFRYKLYGMESPPQIEQRGARTTYSWIVHNLPPLEEISHLPPGANEPAQLLFVPEQLRVHKYRVNHTDWRGIGRWYAELARDRYLDRNSGQDYGVGGKSSLDCRASYDMVTTNTRYVAIEIGIGGWQPYAAERTEKLGYGDCKDMATLLISRLRNQGITSYPCLVLTRTAGLVDPDFPSFDFNHAISVSLIGNDTIWMDPTCSRCPYGDLPGNDENIDVLVVTPEGGELWRTPSSRPEDNRVTRNVRLTIDGDLKATVSAELTVTGNYAQSWRRSLVDMDKDELRQFMYRRFPKGEKEYRLLTYEINNLEDLYEPLVISIIAKRKRALDQIGQTVYCNPFVFNRLFELERVDLGERTYPVNLYYPETIEDRITVSWDTVLAIDSVQLPADDSLAVSFAGISVSSQAENGLAKIDLRKVYTTYQVETNQFEEFEKFRDRMRMIYSGHVKLKMSH